MARNPDHRSRDLLVALTYEHLVALHLRQGQRPEAEKYYRRGCRCGRTSCSSSGTTGTGRRPAAGAWHMRQARRSGPGGRGAARETRRSTELLLQLALLCRVCRAATDPAQKQRHTEKALEAMAAATQEGYKDLVISGAHPDIGLLQQELAYQALLTPAWKRWR